MSKDVETKEIEETVSEESTEKSEAPAAVAPKSDPSSVDMLAKTVKELREAVEKADSRATRDGQLSEDKEKIERISSDIANLQKQVTTVLNSRNDRKGEFEVEERNIHSYTPAQIKSLVNVKAKPNTDIAEIQKGCDDLYILKTLGGRDGLKNEWVQRYMRSQYPSLSKAMDTLTASEGLEWIPENFSMSLYEDVRLQLRVAALHDRFFMPTDPYRFPVEGADATAYSVPEQTTDDADLTAGNRVGASTPGTVNRQYVAQKVGVRVVSSTEFTEDSVIPALPYIRNKIVLALANAQENTVINGDTRTAGTGIDGVSTTNHQLYAYDGYRRAIQLAGTTVNAGGTLTLGDVRACRTAMGKYGVNVNQLAFVVGINAYNNLLNFTEVTTLDKFGTRATILSGQLGALDGIPIIVSEYVNEDLDAVGLNADGGGGTTEVILVRRDPFKFGDRRGITLKSMERIETDQQVLVALQRLDFKSLLVPSTSQTVAAAAVNIALV